MHYVHRHKHNANMYAFEQDKTPEDKIQESYVEKHANKKKNNATLTMVRFSLFDKLKCTAKNGHLSVPRPAGNAVS